MPVIQTTVKFRLKLAEALNKTRTKLNSRLKALEETRKLYRIVL